MADLPDYIPEAAAHAYAVQRKFAAKHWRDEEGLKVLDRLVFRPSMDKVWRNLADLLPANFMPWRVFLMEAVVATWTAKDWGSRVRPARQKFAQDRARALRAGRELVAALERLMNHGRHGFLCPGELEYPSMLFERAAVRKGYAADEEFRLLIELLDNDFHRRVTERGDALDALIAEAEATGKTPDTARLAGCPKPLFVIDLLATVLDALEGWTPGPDRDLYPGQGQKGNPPQVYVRALTGSLKRLADSCGITAHNGRLLSYDDLARVTRAALDLPDTPTAAPVDLRNLDTPEARAACEKARKAKIFDGEDVDKALRRKLKVPAK